MTLWGQGAMTSQAVIIIGWHSVLPIKIKIKFHLKFQVQQVHNLFSAAAVLIHHRTDIILFFQDAKMPSNLKQKSVYADAKCDLLAVMLLGLALAYIYVSRPFWSMINSDMFTTWISTHLSSHCTSS